MYIALRGAVSIGDVNRHRVIRVSVSIALSRVQ